MTNDELNKYILHYLTEDKTHSAIMLTAPWGTGKSYYIQNELKPFLEKDENGKHNCIIVSLYGLKTLFEISKELYIESRTPTFFKRKKYRKLSAFSKPIVSGLFGVGKTVLKALTQIELDFSVDNPNWQKLYSTVDFSGKLIILEDLERSEIDVLEIMGYVNSLVEQDCVKVLLVANEDELIKYKKTDEDLTDDKHSSSVSEKYDKPKIREFTEKTHEYLAKKEKTVSDTIQFEPCKKEAVKEILASFENVKVNQFISECNNDEDIISDIVEITNNTNCYNLRSIIYGIQKTVDLYQRFDEFFNDSFLKSLLLGNIAFSLQLKNDDSTKWDAKNSLYSYELGTSEHPLLRASYDFIKYQRFDKNSFERENTLFCESIKAKETEDRIKSVSNVIYSYYYHSENELRTALDDLKKILEESDDFPLLEFGQLSNYLVSIKYCVDKYEVIDRIRNLMVNKLKIYSGENIEYSIMHHNSITLESQDAKDDLEKWKSDMISALRNGQHNYFSFDYDPSSINDFDTYCRAYRGKIISNHSFANSLDIEKTIEMLKVSSPSQIAVFRGIFRDIYSMMNIGDFFAGDRDSLVKLLEGINRLINDTQDKVSKMQLRYFESYLNEWIAKF